MQEDRSSAALPPAQSVPLKRLQVPLHVLNSATYLFLRSQHKKMQCCLVRIAAWEKTVGTRGHGARARALRYNRFAMGRTDTQRARDICVVVCVGTLPSTFVLVTQRPAGATYSQCKLEVKHHCTATTKSFGFSSRTRRQFNLVAGKAMHRTGRRPMHARCR